MDIFEKAFVCARPRLEEMGWTYLTKKTKQAKFTNDKGYVFAFEITDNPPDDEPRSEGAHYLISHFRKRDEDSDPISHVFIVRADYENIMLAVKNMLSELGTYKEEKGILMPRAK